MVFQPVKSTRPKTSDVKKRATKKKSFNKQSSGSDISEQKSAYVPVINKNSKSNYGSKHKNESTVTKQSDDLQYLGMSYEKPTHFATLSTSTQTIAARNSSARLAERLQNVLRRLNGLVADHPNNNVLSRLSEAFSMESLQMESKRQDFLSKNPQAESVLVINVFFDYRHNQLIDSLEQILRSHVPESNDDGQTPQPPPKDNTGTPQLEPRDDQIVKNRLPIDKRVEMDNVSDMVGRNIMKSQSFPTDDKSGKQSNCISTSTRQDKSGQSSGQTTPSSDINIEKKVSGTTSSIDDPHQLTSGNSDGEESTGETVKYPTSSNDYAGNTMLTINAMSGLDKARPQQNHCGSKLDSVASTINNSLPLVFHKETSQGVPCNTRGNQLTQGCFKGVGSSMSAIRHSDGGTKLDFMSRFPGGYSFRISGNGIDQCGQSYSGISSYLGDSSTSSVSGMNEWKTWTSAINDGNHRNCESTAAALFSTTSESSQKVCDLLSLF